MTHDTFKAGWEAGRAHVLAELRAKVERLPDVTCHRWHEHTDKARNNVGISRAAVLALLSDE